MVVNRSTLPVREIFPGYRARFVHSARTSESWLDIDAGAVAPEHHHPHEQIVNVLQGTLELTVAGVVHVLTAGTTFVIPPGVPHAARALTPCSVLDIFAPTREDYQQRT